MNQPRRKNPFGQRQNRISKSADRLHLRWVLGLGLGSAALLVVLPVAIALQGPPPKTVQAEPVREVANMQNISRASASSSAPVPQVPSRQVETAAIPDGGTGVAEKEPILETPDEENSPATASPDPVKTVVPKRASSDILTIQVPDGKGGTKLVIMDFDQQPVEPAIVIPDWPVLSQPEPTPVPTKIPVAKTSSPKQPNLVLVGRPPVYSPGNPPNTLVSYPNSPAYPFVPNMWNPPRTFVPFTNMGRPNFPTPTGGHCCVPRPHCGFNTMMTFRKGHCGK